MNYFAPRTCKEIFEGDVQDNIPASMPLEDFSGAGSYVLLGPPGAGKTKAFENEARKEKRCYVTARDFVTYDDRPEWHEAVLFIDGLDEMRAGSQDQRVPFDRIRGKLHRLGCPRFRLSCREADWLGTNDRDKLKDVSPDGSIRVLRLDPLSDEDVFNILRCNHGVEDPEQLVNSAKEKGIGSLLGNPQSLRMLVSATGNGKLPETRKETFDLACRKLLLEHNREHNSANRDTVNISGLLSVAGKLCAIQLLTGHTGYFFTGNGTDSGYIDLREIEEDRHSLRNVLRSKLFESADGIHKTPVHRQVAEFLAGLYLKELIQEGLPLRRVLALMTGYDGRVVSELRGLSAWLAAHSPQSRKEIVERDPLGTVLYGDIESFSDCEKRDILDRVAEETEKNPWIARAVGLDPNLEYLATPNMREYFRDALTDAGRDDARQSFVDFLLKTLQHESRIPELVDVLMEIARDNSRQLEIRQCSLRAFIRQREKTVETTAQLKRLLADVHDGLIQDPDDELLGLLLIELYPDSLSASDLWRYFRTPKKPDIYGMYDFFWHNLVDNSTTAQLDALIGEFTGCLDRFLEEYKSGGKRFRLFSELRLRMLPRFLETPGKKFSPDDLFSWFWVASGPEVWGPTIGEEKTVVREWLNNYPETKKAIFKAGMGRGILPEQIFTRLFLSGFSGYGLGASPPPDFALWCLEEAADAADGESVDFFLRQAVRAIRNSDFDKGFSKETVKGKLAGHPDLERRFAELMTEYDSRRGEPSLHEKEVMDLREKALEHQEAKRQAWLDEIRSCEKALRENLCPLHLIHELAKVYFGLITDVDGSTPLERLNNFLDGDEKLVSAVLESFKGSVNRDEVPDETEIINLGADSRLHYLTYPFLAGLKEIFTNDVKSAGESMTEKQMRQALAFYYAAPVPSSILEPKPHWYGHLVENNPGMVSDVLIKSVRSMIRKNRSAMMSVQPLLLQEDHANIASLAVLPVLKAFPARCRARQMGELNYLLRSALLHCDENQFLNLIKKKLSFSGMNIAQRVYWLAAGLILSPSGFIKEMETYLVDRERRVQNLVDFLTLSPKIPPTRFVERLDVPATKLLIRLIGSLYKPRSLSSVEAESSFDKSWQAAELICGLIQQLACLRSPCAAKVLEELSSDNALCPWSSYMLSVSSEQKSLRRERDFRQPSVKQALKTLESGQPANAADLAALLTDILNDLAREIRDGNTSAWRQYWNMDAGNPASLRTEDLCRDALLSDLKKKLMLLGIDAQPEGRYADDKRSDIRVAYGKYSIPVEIKKSNSRDLWSAVKEQLIAKYTRDPETDGYGIYLVFWFGREHRQPPGEGTLPQNARELQERLLNGLSADQKRKISVCVIDVASS